MKHGTQNVTITVNGDVLRAARIRALERGTSVNEVLGEYLAAYAGLGSSEDAVERALGIADSVKARSGGRRWKRDDLYER